MEVISPFKIQWYGWVRLKLCRFSYAGCYTYCNAAVLCYAYLSCFSAFLCTQILYSAPIIIMILLFYTYDYHGRVTVIIIIIIPMKTRARRMAADDTLCCSASMHKEFEIALLFHYSMHSSLFHILINS